MSWKKYFCVNVNKYDSRFDFDILRPASLNIPKDNAVMFICEDFMKYVSTFERCSNCLVFWPKNVEIPTNIIDKHVYVLSEDPRTEYSRFFRDNKITYYPTLEKMDFVNGYFISPNAKVGKNCTIFPGAYIGGDVEIGDNVYIGSGVKLMGETHIGNNVIIRENAVLGADGLSTNRDEFGRAVTMPQFGGIVLEDDVQIGALTVIGRGAIDNTHISRGSKIDNSCFISHNVQIGEDTFIVGESIMFGSSSTGGQAYISGNSCVRDGINIGKNALVGMGAVVVKDVPDNTTVKGNPAK